mgnify:FL=1
MNGIERERDCENELGKYIDDFHVRLPDTKYYESIRKPIDSQFKLGSPGRTARNQDFSPYVTRTRRSNEV